MLFTVSYLLSGFMAKYLKRYIELVIDEKLKTSGAVLVSGPKFCGKTTTSSLFAKSVIKLNNLQTIRLAQIDPRNVLGGEAPHLIDEWQTVPELWDLVREEVDNRGDFGQFILTGSSTPVDKTNIFHSGAGRIVQLKMRPMSLFESGDSTGEVSLRTLFDQPDTNVFSLNERHSLSDMAYYICRGGWPMSIIDDRKVALSVTKNYYNGLLNFENSENSKFRNKNNQVFEMILRAYARNISTEATNTTLIADVIENNNRTMSAQTFDEYMDALRDLFIIEDTPAWNPNLRSKSVVRTSSTRHFIDTSIACAALKTSPALLLNDLNSMGFFFEDLVVRDLNIYIGALDGNVMHYRDSRGLECDAVLVLDDGRWALVEVKLGGQKGIDEGAQHLLTLKKDIAAHNGPAFLMIITANGPAYRRPDGVFVVPLNCLKD